MGKERYHVSSITNAMRGKALLDKNGIRSCISRDTSPKIKNGCGYCIDVSSNFVRAEELLYSSGIHIRDKKRIGDT